MNNIAQQESLVKASLFQFIKKHVPNADLKVIDDIVLAYVISILEEASQDPCFDVEGFIEMMSAYIPEFANIDPGAVCDWILELEAELRRDESDESSNNDDSANSDRISLTLQSLNEMLPTATKTNRWQCNSESSEEASETPTRRAVLADDQYEEQCRALLDMFPNTPVMEIKHCIHIASGDVSLACATLLLRREAGAALPPPPPKATPSIDDSELKNRIIARYSYVDKDSETKEHRPLAPKFEPKKLVRYRDNKIVSLKGERYTEVPKSGIDEEHLKKPKKQHCP